MSAKATYAKPKLNLPDLPEELWLDILWFTCRIGSSHDVLDAAPKLLSFTGDLPWRAWRKSMAIQRRVILVCKSWHRLALPFLYEHLVILDESYFLRLSKMLANSSADDATSPLSLAKRRTRRLDMYFSLDASTLTVSRFIQLIQSLPNLRIVIWRAGYQHVVPRPAFDSFLALPNLQVLQSECSRESQPFASIASTNLRAVSFPVAHDTAISAHPRLSFPNLSQILLRVGDIHLVECKSVLREHGSTVDSVLIRGHSASDLPPLLAYITSFCPRVQYIGIQNTFQCFNSAFRPEHRAMSLPPTVHTLGLQFRKQRVRNRVFRETWNNLEKLKADGIRIEEQSAGNLLRRPGPVGEMERVLQRRGWRFEIGDMCV